MAKARAWGGQGERRALCVALGKARRDFTGAHEGHPFCGRGSEGGKRSRVHAIVIRVGCKVGHLLFEALDGLRMAAGGGEAEPPQGPTPADVSVFKGAVKDEERQAIGCVANAGLRGVAVKIPNLDGIAEFRGEPLFAEAGIVVAALSIPLGGGGPEEGKRFGEGTLNKASFGIADAEGVLGVGIPLVRGTAKAIKGCGGGTPEAIAAPAENAQKIEGLGHAGRGCLSQPSKTLGGGFLEREAIVAEFGHAKASMGIAEGGGAGMPRERLGKVGGFVKAQGRILPEGAHGGGIAEGGGTEEPTAGFVEIVGKHEPMAVENGEDELGLDAVGRGGGAKVLNGRFGDGVATALENLQQGKGEAFGGAVGRGGGADSHNARCAEIAIAGVLGKHGGFGHRDRVLIGHGKEGRRTEAELEAGGKRRGGEGKRGDKERGFH